MSFFFFPSEVFNVLKFVLFYLYLSILDLFFSLHFSVACAGFFTQYLLFICHCELHTLHLTSFRFFVKVKKLFLTFFFLSLLLSHFADSVFSALKKDLLLNVSSHFSISIS